MRKKNIRVEFILVKERLQSYFLVIPFSSWNLGDCFIPLLHANAKHVIFPFLSLFVRSFVSSSSQFPRTSSQNWTSEIFQCIILIFLLLLSFNTHIPFQRWHPCIFLSSLRVVILKEKRIYIYSICLYVCVYFFLLLHFVPLSSNQNTNKDCNCFMFLFFSFICHKL